MGIFSKKKERPVPQVVLEIELMRDGEDGSGTQLISQLPSNHEKHPTATSAHSLTAGLQGHQASEATAVDQQPEDSDQILFTVVIDHKKMSKDGAHVTRGDAKGETLAKVKAQTIYFEPGHKDFTRREMVYRKSRFADRRAFRYQREQYHFKSSSTSQTLYLFNFRAGKHDPPLAVFEMLPDRQSRGVIRIYGTSDEADSLVTLAKDPETGLQIYQTTPFFDVALMSFYCTRSFLLGTSIVKAMQQP